MELLKRRRQVPKGLVLFQGGEVDPGSTLAFRVSDFANILAREGSPRVNCRQSLGSAVNGRHPQPEDGEDGRGDGKSPAPFTGGGTMHIPAYAQDELLHAMPPAPSENQTLGVNCSLCDESFAGSGTQRIAVEPGNEDSLYACRDCLTAFVAQVRRQRHAASGRTAQGHSGTLPPALKRYLSSIENVRRAGEAVERLAEAGNLESLQLAWLMVSLESAHAWAVAERPEPLSAVSEGVVEVKRVELELFIQMHQVRSLVANVFTYYLINQAASAEPEMCAEFECLSDCQGHTMPNTSTAVPTTSMKPWRGTA